MTTKAADEYDAIAERLAAIEAEKAPPKEVFPQQGCRGVIGKTCLPGVDARDGIDGVDGHQCAGAVGVRGETGMPGPVGVDIDVGADQSVTVTWHNVDGSTTVTELATCEMSVGLMASEVKTIWTRCEDEG